MTSNATIFYSHIEREHVSTQIFRFLEAYIRCGVPYNKNMTRHMDTGLISASLYRRQHAAGGG
jgi:hypothetical protein